MCVCVCVHVCVFATCYQKRGLQADVVAVSPSPHTLVQPHAPGLHLPDQQGPVGEQRHPEDTQRNTQSVRRPSRGQGSGTRRAERALPGAVAEQLVVMVPLQGGGGRGGELAVEHVLLVL